MSKRVIKKKESDSTVTIPNDRRVVYKVDGKVVRGKVKFEDDVTVTAEPATGTVFRPDTPTEWRFHHGDK